MSEHGFEKVDWDSGLISFQQINENQKNNEVSILFVGDISTTGPSSGVDYHRRQQ